MKQIEKIHTSYKGKALDAEMISPIKNADEEDLRVLLVAMMLEQMGDGSGVESSEICENLGITQDEFAASVKYWRGAGFVSVSKKKSADEEEKVKVESAHKGGKVDKERMPTYTTEELTNLMEKRNITSSFIGEASRVYGKIFNQHEVEIVVRMIDYIGLDSESVLLLLSYYGKQKKPLRYIEKAALSFYDDGIVGVRALQERLSAIERREDMEGKIRSMFGMNHRALTTKEKKYIVSWVEKMGFSIDMIRLAYDKTVDITHEPSPAYANGILERWYADGIDTPEKVEAADEKREEEKQGQVKKSFDNNKFFEEALKRSYGEN